MRSKMMKLLITLLLFFGCYAFYTPIRKFDAQLRLGNNGSTTVITDIPVSFFTGISIKDVSYNVLGSPFVKINSSGSVSVVLPPASKTNLTYMTAEVIASFRDWTTSTKINVTFLPPTSKHCSAQETCFAGVPTFRVFKGSDTTVALGRIHPANYDPDCKKPVYELLKGGSVVGLKGNALYVSARKMKFGEVLDVEVECSVSGGKDRRSFQVIADVVNNVLPLPMGSTPLRVVVPNEANTGKKLLIGWICVERTSSVHLETANFPQFALSIESHSISSIFMSSKLIIIHLTWTSKLNETQWPITVQARLKVENLSLVEVTSKLEKNTTLIPSVDYPEDQLSVTKSLYAFSRIVQPYNLRNLTRAKKWLKFSSALPWFVNSNFNVTSDGGIVYMSELKGDLQLNSGALISWRNKTGRLLGLKWISIIVNGSTSCNQSLYAEDDVCSEAERESDCVGMCGLASSARMGGRCSWRPRPDSKPPEIHGLSKNYSTCSTEVHFCPDSWCDPLEKLESYICPQDCTQTENVVGSGLPGKHGGIEFGSALCTCTKQGKCHCGASVPKLVTKVPPKKPETLVDMPAGLETCNGTCIALLLIMGSSVITLLAVIVIVLAKRSTCLMKNKSAFKENSGYLSDTLLLTTVDAQPSQPQPNQLQIEVDPKWEVPRSSLTIEDSLGEGEFGRVLKATALDLPSCPGFTVVAVKTLKSSAGASELADLLSEYQLLKEVSHTNVIKLLGACTSPGGPVYIVIEYCALGSLRAYLRRCRNERTNLDMGAFGGQSRFVTSPKELLGFAWQISRGMAYLAEMKLVHRDLAARNVLLTSDKVCKVSDFGLTRDVYEDDAYLKKSKGRVPVKWMALESLSDHVYTAKSDVWAFGVILWELVTLGASPYPGVALQNLYPLLKNGYRMPRPNNCSGQLYEIMLKCWHVDPNRRPSFLELVQVLERMLEDNTDYLDCNVHMVINPTYFEDVCGGDDGLNGITFSMELKDLTRLGDNQSYDVPKSVKVMESEFSVQSGI